MVIFYIILVCAFFCIMVRPKGSRTCANNAPFSANLPSLVQISVPALQINFPPLQISVPPCQMSSPLHSYTHFTNTSMPGSTDRFFVVGPLGQATE